METIEGYKFGRIYKEKISHEEADKFATVFGEGSPSLTELIKYCILNDIPTLASCKGHPEKKVIGKIIETGYITFCFDENYNKDDFAYFLASIPTAVKEIMAHLETNNITDRTITLRVPAKLKGMSEEYFKVILEKIKEYKGMKRANQEININPDIKKITDYIFYSINCNEVFEITKSKYKKFERNGMYLNKTATCPANEMTSVLHAKFAKYMKKRKTNLDDLLSEHKTRK